MTVREGSYTFKLTLEKNEDHVSENTKDKKLHK